MTTTADLFAHLSDAELAARLAQRGVAGPDVDWLVRNRAVGTVAERAGAVAERIEELLS